MILHLLWHLSKDPIQLQIHRAPPTIKLISLFTQVVHQHNLESNIYAESESVKKFPKIHLQKGTYSVTYLAITSYLAYKVNRTFLPLTHLLEEAPVRGTEQQSITLLILRPPKLQNTEGGVTSLSIRVKYV